MQLKPVKGEPGVFVISSRCCVLCDAEEVFALLNGPTGVRDEADNQGLYRCPWHGLLYPDQTRENGRRVKLEEIRELGIET